MSDIYNQNHFCKVVDEVDIFIVGSMTINGLHEYKIPKAYY